MRIKKDDIHFEHCENCGGLEFGFVPKNSIETRVCCKSCGKMLRIATDNDLNLMYMESSDNQGREAYMRGFQDGYKIAMSDKDYWANDIKITDEAGKYINDFNQQFPLVGKIGKGE